MPVFPKKKMSFLRALYFIFADYKIFSCHSATMFAFDIFANLLCISQSLVLETCKKKLESMPPLIFSLKTPKIHKKTHFVLKKNFYFQFIFVWWSFVLAKTDIVFKFFPATNYTSWDCSLIITTLQILHDPHPYCPPFRPPTSITYNNATKI